MMKEKIVRRALLVLLVAASVLSFVYLNTVNTQDSPEQPAHLQTPATVVEQEQAKRPSAGSMPEVKVLYRLLEGAARFIPAS